MNGRIFLICSVLVLALYFFGMLSATNALIVEVGVGLVSIVL